MQIKIKASDTAKPDLTELKLQLDELGAKVETARVDVDDRDGEVKLLRLNSRLAELNRKTANPKISISGAARAQAEIAAIDLELDRLDEKAASSGRGGLLSRILYGVSGSIPLSGEDSPGGGIPIVGSLFGPAGLAIVPAIAAALTELTGLVSGLAAAGAGAGSFAALAIPAFRQLQTSYQGLNAAQQKYDQAVSLQKMDPTKAHAAAVKAALDQLNLAGQAIGKLPSQEQGAIDGIYRLTQEYQRMARAFAPEVFKVFNSGLALAGKLLPDILPFAQTFADVVDSLLGKAGKFAGSKGFADWLKQFHSLEGPALGAIGTGIGKVVVAVGKLLTVMSGKDVAHTINIAFGAVAGTINVLTYAVRRLMQNWDGMSRTAARDARDVSKSFDSMRHDISAAFDAIRHWAAAWANNMAHDVTQVVSFFLRLPGRIMSAVSRLPGMLFRAGVNAIEGLLNGMRSVAGRMLSTVEGWGHDIANALVHPFGIHFSEPSEATQMIKAGKNITAGLGTGLLSGRGTLAAAAARVSAAAYPHVPGGYGPGGTAGGAPVRIQLEWTGGGGNDAFMTFLRQNVRVHGGDPTMFQRKVAFR